MKPPLALVLVAAGVASVVGAGAYTVASASASSLAGVFATTESELHARRAEAQTAMSRASAQHLAAREKCERLKGGKRDYCLAAARVDERRSVRREMRTVESARRAGAIRAARPGR